MCIKLIQFLCLAVLAIGCAKKGPLSYSDGTGLNSGSGRDVSGAPQALQLLSTHCASCHGQVAGGAGGLSDILNVQHLLDSGYATPASPDTSPIMIEIVSGRMPPFGPLSASDIETIRQWIADGLPVGELTPALPGPRAPPLAATYQSIYANILYPKCITCHGPTRSAGGVRFTTYSDTMREVRAGNPTGSPLFQEIESGNMPEAPAAPLTTNEVAAIRQWIQAGALNN